MDVYIWSGSGSRAGIRYGVDAPPIFFAACEDEIESEIADLKAAGKRIIRVEKKEDLERKISFA